MHFSFGDRLQYNFRPAIDAVVEGCSLIRLRMYMDIAHSLKWKSHIWGWVNVHARQESEEDFQWFIHMCEFHRNSCDNKSQSYKRLLVNITSHGRVINGHFPQKYLFKHVSYHKEWSAHLRISYWLPCQFTCIFQNSIRFNEKIAKTRSNL